MTSGETHPFRGCDIQIYMGQLQLDVFGAKAYQLRATYWSGMTFSLQNSGVTGEIVGHARSGALHSCPVVGLRISAYCYASMELPMTRFCGYTGRSPLALCATSRVATSPRPSNLQLVYIGKNLVLDRMMSVLAPVEQRQPALTSSGPIPNSAPCTRDAYLRALVVSIIFM